MPPPIPRGRFFVLRDRALDDLDIFLICPPGFEDLLKVEALEHGLTVTSNMPGGVSISGDWDDVARANVYLRGAVRVLVRLAEFRAMHLAQLDKRARKIDWATWLKPDMPIRVEATCRKSRIYHHKAAAQRVERAICETLGMPSTKDGLSIKVRIEDDLCTISLDTSGAPLHIRGLKQQVNKAPMRENLAAMFLRDCGYTGNESVYDPMCGSGTFPIEAAEIAMGLVPGRAREFAFEGLAVQATRPDPKGPKSTTLTFYGSDRDTGAITMSRANAERAGLADYTQFDPKPISEITPPSETPGLVIANPPYGGRIGNKKPLYGLYAAFGTRLMAEFSGWRVGIITSDAALAKVTGLPFQAPGPIIDHGGTKIRLWQTAALD